MRALRIRAMQEALQPSSGNVYDEDMQRAMADALTVAELEKEFISGEGIWSCGGCSEWQCSEWQCRAAGHGVSAKGESGVCACTHTVAWWHCICAVACGWHVVRRTRDCGVLAFGVVVGNCMW